MDHNVTADFLNVRSADEPLAARQPGPDGLRATSLWLRQTFAELRFEIHDIMIQNDPAADPLRTHRRVAAYASLTANGHLRATVQGRADTIFRYGPVELHPHAIRSVLATASTVREYQIRQTLAGWTQHLSLRATPTSKASTTDYARRCARPA
jgi:phenylacetate-coenzyme A ligase PaaK-like adenylate-forming protein